MVEHLPHAGLGTAAAQKKYVSGTATGVAVISVRTEWGRTILYEKPGAVRRRARRPVSPGRTAVAIAPSSEEAAAGRRREHNVNAG
jgi:hypothetical protein